MALWGLLVDSAKRTHKQLPRRHSSVRRSFGWKNPDLWEDILVEKNLAFFVGYVFLFVVDLQVDEYQWISMNKSNPNENVDTNSCMFHVWCQESAGLQSHFKIWPKEFILSNTRWPFRLLHGHTGDLLPNDLMESVVCGPNDVTSLRWWTCARRCESLKTILQNSDLVGSFFGGCGFFWSGGSHFGFYFLWTRGLIGDRVIPDPYKREARLNGYRVS